MMKKIIKEWRSIFSDRKPLLMSMDYDQYWAKRRDRHFGTGQTITENIIMQNIRPNSKVLELGCGDGDLLYKLKKTKHCKVFGYDVSEVALKRAKAKGIKCKKADLNDKNFKLKESYDYVILTEVIEHLIKPERVMEALKGKYNEKVIITFPNYAFVTNRLRLLFGRVPLDWHWHPAEHLRQWTLKDMKFWLSGPYGFKYKIIKIYPHIGIPVLKKVLPRLFASGFVIVLK